MSAARAAPRSASSTTASATGAVAGSERDELVRQDPVGLPGQERRAALAPAVEVDRGSFADLERLPVGQETQAVLILPARDCQHAVGDHGVAELICAGGAEDVAAAVLI